MTANASLAAGQPTWMAHAWRELGQRETAGGRDNPRIIELYRLAGHPEVAHDEVAWCAAFVGACLERAGHRSTRSLMARSYLGWGVGLAAPRPGCIAVFSRGGNPAEGHVGFWVGETAEHILLLGGNQGDAVSVARQDRSRLLGYRWLEADPRAAEKASAAPAGTVDRASDSRPEKSAPANAAAANATALFEIALAHVLKMEGGYTDDPIDPGGPTNKGITLGDYARHRSVAITASTRAELVLGLKRIADAEVRQIYHQRYWEPSGAAALPAALALMHFDAAVNHGLTGAARMLQGAVGAEVDGEVGPITLRLARQIAPGRAVERYADLRRERYRSLHHFWRFGRGWLNRVDNTLRQARSLIDATPTSPAGKPGDQSMPTDNNGDRTQADSKWWGESMTIWGTLITALSTVLPAIAPLLGIEITGEVVRQVGQETIQVVQAIGGLMGTILAIYGRTRASKTLARRVVNLQL